VLALAIIAAVVAGSVMMVGGGILARLVTDIVMGGGRIRPRLVCLRRTEPSIQRRSPTDHGDGQAEQQREDEPEYLHRFECGRIPGKGQGDAQLASRPIAELLIAANH